MKNVDKYTLITGGTEGIGLELAKLFARDKHNLFIVARNEDKLHNIKQYLEATYGILVITMVLDLSVDKSCEQLTEIVDKKHISVDNLINNVGIGSYGYFIDEEDGFDNKIININVRTITKLTKHFAQKMALKKQGGILNIASTAAFAAGPKMALYYSTKAYVLSLTEALHEEVKPLGIRVSCVCPGPVRTGFQEKAGIKKSEGAKKFLMDPETVAKIAYREYLNNKAIIVPGMINKLLVFFNKIVPRSLSRRIIYKTNK